MDRQKKKNLRSAWKKAQRSQVREALPLGANEFQALFDMLDEALGRSPCDDTTRLTAAWLTERGHDVQTVLAWLRDKGGYCDCEVLANVEQEVEDALKDT